MHTTNLPNQVLLRCRVDLWVNKTAVVERKVVATIAAHYRPIMVELEALKQILGI